jgi:hypothetical protein
MVCSGCVRWAFALWVVVACSATLHAADTGLVGYWKLAGDTRDHSGNGLDAVNHNVDANTGEFNGRDAWLEIADSPKLRIGDGNFTISAQVSTNEDIDDVLGDLVTKFDPDARRGFNLTFTSNTSGYNSQGNTRHLFFGLDNATEGKWADCGRPGGVCHSSDALTVFNGDLYVGTVDAPDEADWAHVYRYKGDATWEDCGRVGTGKVRGVYAMIVHDGALYAATAGPHGGNESNKGDFARVYRYRGGKEWEDLGQPGDHYRVNSLASYRGKLYALAINTGGKHGGVYLYEGGKNWTKIGDFGRPHTSGVHNGRLYAAYPRGEVFAYDGKEWEHLGNPIGSEKDCNQLHAQGAHRGEWFVGTWPLGKVAVQRDGKWVILGRLGDSTEIVGLTAYNGSLYSGTIPRAEVFRYDGPDRWTSIKRLFDPPNYDVIKDVEDWSRASSMTVYQGKMFVSTADCYRAMLSQPRENEIRGKVYSFSTGEGVSVDRDLGPGWKHIAATRDGSTLRLYVDGKLAATSKSDAKPIAAANNAPLLIGLGPHSHFRGRMREIRIYDRALNGDEVAGLKQ